MRGWAFAILCALSGAFLSGCATIVSGTSQIVNFNSNPEGATIKLNGSSIGTTPQAVRLDKGKIKLLSFEKDGYKTFSMNLETEIDGWFWGNIIFGGFLGSTTDGVSGAIYKYSPSQYMVSLQPEKSSRIDAQTSQSSSQKIRQYIVVSYKNIMADLNDGEGEYLSSLFQLLGVPKNREHEVAKKIAFLSRTYTNIPEFADQVSSLDAGSSSNASEGGAESAAKPQAATPSEGSSLDRGVSSIPDEVEKPTVEAGSSEMEQGYALEKQKKWDDAIQQFAAAVKLLPPVSTHRVEAEEQLGALAIRSGRIDDARKYYLAAIRSMPSPMPEAGPPPQLAAAYAGFAYCMEKQGKAEAAVKNYRKALQLNPDSQLKKHVESRLANLKSQDASK